MAKLNKRQKAVKEKIEHGKIYSVDEAMALVKDMPKAKFIESVDVSVNLGVDLGGRRIIKKKITV